MFGYVIIDKPNILIKDFATYKSYYCGLCKRTGSLYGQLMRLSVNYDIVLLSLLVHNYEKVTPEFTEEHCILHPVGQKKPVAKSDGIFGRIVDINIILGYYKACDDVADEGRHKGVKNFLGRRMKKLKVNYPALCAAAELRFGELRRLEETNCRDENAVSGCFGDVLSAAAEAATEKADDNLRKLCYNLGKWIYYIDALDDITDDYEQKRYNLFAPSTGAPDADFFDKQEKYFRHLLYSAIDDITQSYDKMDITVSEGALSNIIYLGLRARTEAVLKGRGNKCQKIRL
ncbi:MAG: DUF5685 family protein [Clostridia bacterium]|nr:DUF5685 family protein [Clostridia bacterium]